MKFYDALAAANVPAPPANRRATANGFVRYGKNNRYWLNQRDGVAFFGDHQTGESHYWFADNENPADAQKIAELRLKLAQLCSKQRQEEAHLHTEVAARCERLWDAMDTAGQSLYLERKQVGPFSVRYYKDSLVIPLRDVGGKLWSLQYVSSDGAKRFSTGGRKRGCFHVIGEIEDLVIVGEGYATLASIHMATGLPCVVAFDAGNLEAVIETLVSQYPNLSIIIAADDDRWKPEQGNTGRLKANEVARRFGCVVALPRFKDCITHPTDWNDLHVLEGLQTVKAQWAEVLHVGQ